jgi:GlcNAc-PI de-N-acetylase
MTNLSYTSCSFYIVAHADDWQLFMQPNVYYDLINPSIKVIFIIITAGDAGAEENYWRAREEGSKSSIRFCLAPRFSIHEFSDIGNFNGHQIHYFIMNNSTSYFLRLPDGNLDSKGFAKYNYESLPQLKETKISKITAVDKSTNYKGWEDFRTTVEKIILFESSEKKVTYVNYINPDKAANPDDHADHICTGEALSQICCNSTFMQRLFVGYSVNNTKNKLTETDLFWKAGMFAAYEKTVFDLSGYSTLREGLEIYYKWCLSLNKYITIN